MIGQYRLKKTIWHNATVCVGLAEDYVADGRNTVVIQETWKRGDRAGKPKHPGVYEITGDEIRKYPVEIYKGMPPQYFVPLSTLRPVTGPRVVEKKEEPPKIKTEEQTKLFDIPERVEKTNWFTS